MVMTVVAPPTTAEAMAGYVEVARAIAARDPQAVAAALSALHDSPETVALTLRAHHLVGLVRRDLADLGDGHGLDPALVQALAAAQPIARATPDELRSLFVEVRDALERMGIPVLLLKGQSFAERPGLGSAIRAILAAIRAHFAEGNACDNSARLPLQPGP